MGPIILSNDFLTRPSLCSGPAVASPKPARLRLEANLTVKANITLKGNLKFKSGEVQYNVTTTSTSRTITRSIARTENQAGQADQADQAHPEISNSSYLSVRVDVNTVLL